MSTTINPNMAALLAALRSGSYLQAKSRLKVVDKDGIARHCCLGVAEELAQAAGVEGAGLVKPLDDYLTRPGGAHEGKTSYINHDGTNTLSRATAEWLGQPDRADIDARDKEGCSCPASVLNDTVDDEGHHRYTFAEIADQIERACLS